MKKVILVILSVLLSVTVRAQTVGDLNGDGNVDVGDIMTIINIMAD